MNLGMGLYLDGRNASSYEPGQILARAGVPHAWRSDLGVTLNGSNVAQWNDLVGSAHLIQGTAGNQPAYNATDAGYMGQPTLQAATTGKYLAAAGVTSNQPLALWFVGEFSTAGNVAFALAAGNPYLVNSAGNVAIYAGTSLGSGVTSTTKRAILAVFNGGTSFVGADNWLTGGTTGVAGANNGSAVGLFAQSNGAFSSVAKVAEVILSGVPDAAEKTAMAAYFLARYGITVT